MNIVSNAIYGYQVVKPMTKEEFKKMYPVSRNTLHIPLPDFMAMPCSTTENLIVALKGWMRLHGIDIEDHDCLQITIEERSNVVRIETYAEVPF